MSMRIRSLVSWALVASAGLTTGTAHAQGYFLGQDINREIGDEYRLQRDQNNFQRDLNNGNYAGALNDLSNINRDRQNIQLDQAMIRNDLYGQPGYYPQQQPQYYPQQQPQYYPQQQPQYYPQQQPQYYPQQNMAPAATRYQVPAQYAGTPGGYTINWGGVNYRSNGDGTMSP